MAIYEPGRALDCTPDPVCQENYQLSQSAEFELRMLVEALRAAHALCEGFSDEHADFHPLEAGALFRVFAEHGAHLLATARIDEGGGGT